MAKTLKGYLREYGGRPKKALGQVFLIERTVQERILDLAELDGTDTVVEIGPGTGALTREILPRVERLIALEKDPALVSFLRTSIPEDPARFHLLCADALRFDYRRTSRILETSLKVVGNLPYVISAPLLMTFVEQREAFSLLLLMLQKEVAQRLVAAPGTKAYGSITILCRSYFLIRLERHVSRHCFHPVPKVDSAILRFTPRAPCLAPAGRERLFRRLVRAAFSRRRKTLLNALRGSPEARLPPERLRSILVESGIDPDRRPETLSPEEYALLARALPADAFLP